MRHTLGNIAVGVLGGENALVPRHGFEQQLGEMPQVVRTEGEIDHGVGSLYLFHHVLLLHHAAANGDYLPRALLFAVVELSDIAENAHLRVLAHGAGVHNDNIGFKLVLRNAVAHFGEVAAQLFAVGFILLAAVCIDHCQRMAFCAHEFVVYLAADILLAADVLNAYLFSFVCHISNSLQSVDYIIY